MKEGNFEEEIIFGVHPVLEALKNGADIDKLLIQKGIAPEHLNHLMLLPTMHKFPIS